MDQYCTQCGTKNTDDAAFCSECGQALQDKEKSVHAKTGNANEAAYKTDSYEQTPELNWIWALFSFKGRMNRQRFWLYNLLVALLSFASIMILAFTMNDSVTSLWLIFACWTYFAISIKRWHDVDKSGWFSIFGLFPFVSLVLGFIEGSNGANQYGADIVNS